MTKIYAVHFLVADGSHLLGSRSGRDGKPWKVGETRTATGELEICSNGYHFSPTWEAAFRGQYIYGPLACIVEVNQTKNNMNGYMNGYKGVSRSRKLIEKHLMTAKDFNRFTNFSNKSSNRARGAKAFAKFMGKLTGWYDVP